jgi:hypothetical protein
MKWNPSLISWVFTILFFLFIDILKSFLKPGRAHPALVFFPISFASLLSSVVAVHGSLPIANLV